MEAGDWESETKTNSYFKICDRKRKRKRDEGEEGARKARGWGKRMKAMTSEWEDRGVKVHEGDGGKKQSWKGEENTECWLSPGFFPAPTPVIKWITEGEEKGEDEGIEREHAWLSVRLHVRSPELSDMRVGQLSAVLDIIPQMLTTTISTMAAERCDYRTVPRWGARLRLSAKWCITATA